MASKASLDFYEHVSSMSAVRSMAETLLHSKKVKKISARQAYEMACKQVGVEITDMPIYKGAVKRLDLPKDAKVLIDNHGKIIGRTAKARRFYNKLQPTEKKKIEGDIREALFQMRSSDLIRAEAVIGLDSELMIKAHFITTADDANNVFNWLMNFTPYEAVAQKYENSKPLPIQDIIIVGFNKWTINDDFYENTGSPQLALVDQDHNVLFNLGMRYFGERKKGTLTLAWTSGMRLGMAASHAGIKELDFSGCEGQLSSLGKRSIAFFGLSGTGKSSHTNSHSNAGTIPKGVKTVVLHDDAFQIDIKNKQCFVWEPTLFDKTDSRDFDDVDWEYLCAGMNQAMIQRKGKRVLLGLDIRQDNGRALFDRDLLGNWVNRCAFPQALIWLMKDSILPPILKLSDTNLAVAMGTALITRRNRAENVSEAELQQLVFEPFANPFRVYELYKDVIAYKKVIDSGAECYAFNSSSYWKSSDDELEPISLKTSLTLQTAIFTGCLDWEDWSLVSGAQIPTKESVEKILPGFYDRYNPNTRENPQDYEQMVFDRFIQRHDFVRSTDVKTKSELYKGLLSALEIEK